jgi:hypothetical protein
VIAGLQVRADEVTYKELYNIVLARRLGDSANAYKERARVVSEALFVKTGVRAGPEDMWTAFRIHYCTTKTADLFWKLLHDNILCGKRLDWRPEGVHWFGLVVFNAQGRAREGPAQPPEGHGAC